MQKVKGGIGTEAGADPVSPLNGQCRGSDGGTAQPKLTGSLCGVCSFQCQDLMSQTSSPLSQNDSSTGRSADLLLPSGDTAKRQHDRGTEVATYSRAERYKAQVSECVCVSWGPSAQAPPSLEPGRREDDAGRELVRLIFPQTLESTAPLCLSFTSKVVHTSISTGTITPCATSTQLLGDFAIANFNPLSSKSPTESCSNPLWLHIHASSHAGGPSGVQAHPAPPQPGSPVCPCSKLAAPAREAHLRVLRVRGQRKWLLVCGGGEDEEALGLRLLSMGSQGYVVALGFNISPSFTQYLGSMLIKDLRGTESTQDACAKMRVGRPWGWGLHLQPVGDDVGWGGGTSVVPQTLSTNRQCHCLW